MTSAGLFPAEHRALRELHAMVRQLCGHWARLAARLGGEPGAVLGRGAADAQELLAEINERAAAHGVHGFPAAEGVGGGLAGAHGIGDLMLERNQALRSAVHDIQHVTMLLGYLAELAKLRDDTSSTGWLGGWEARLRAVEAEAREAAVAEGRHPERAIEPAGPGKLGRAGHAVANGLGTLGEAVDTSVVGRAARKLRRD